MHDLSMQDLFDLEDVFKRYAEQRWLLVLRKNRSTVMSPNPSAGVGYKLLSAAKGAVQSGDMGIFVSKNLDAVSEGEVERNHLLSELSREGSIYPRPSQGTS
jgi:hypothetical protein